MSGEATAGTSGKRGFPMRKGTLLVAGSLILLLAVFWLGRATKGERHESAANRSASGERKIKFWTCSMHPQIRQPEPGKCPICAMDLIPVYEGGGERAVGARELAMTEDASALADVQVAKVERKFAEVRVNMVGRVDYDETRLAHIAAWFPGRLDRLYVDYTGIPVRKGDHLADIFSPELLAAQEELIQAGKALSAAGKGPADFMRGSAKSTLEASRKKLLLWGLTAEQVAEIERSGKISDHMTIYSPTAGIVISKHLNEGSYVMTGTRIYTIADLTKVWVNLDAYESDLEWIRYGQDVEFQTEAYAGQTFRGMISFIQPMLDPKTRTVKLRVIADNADGRLKPGMFVRAEVRPRLAAGGRVMEARLAGKWICPMHPEVVKDGPGPCDVCGMPLAKTEELGYAAAKEIGPPLVIPASAPLITGERAVVYVKTPDSAQPTYAGREVVLGPRAGDHYIVLAGLKEGEQVVVRGNFKIDSALQIEAKPSMMNPAGGGAGGATGHHHGAAGQPSPDAPSLPATKDVGRFEVPATFRVQLSKVVAAYLDLHRALAGDDAATAKKAVGTLNDRLAAVDMKLLAGDVHMAWMKDSVALAAGADKAAAAKDLAELREAFALLSDQLASTVRRFGPVEQPDLFVLKCPMAFNNRGAVWLATSREVSNPYFGAAMLKCGEVAKSLQEGGKPAGSSQ